MARKPSQQAQWEHTHEIILQCWNSGLNAKQIREALDLGENTVLRHLRAEGLSAQKRIREQEAAARAEREAAATARRVFRDLKGEQIELFPKTCQTCGRPMPAGTNARYCCEECRPSTYKAKSTSELTCCDCGTTYYYEKGVSSLSRCEHCHAEHEREVKRQNNRYGKTLNARGRYWTRITGADYEPINPEVVFDMDGYVCYLCGCELSERDGVVRGNYPTVDHVTPLSGGGPHTYDNVRACCHTCNSYKGAAMPEEVDDCA